MEPCDIIDRYLRLYNKMSKSSDPKKMIAFGNAEKWAFEKLANSHTDIAEEWLDKIEASEWNNYISEREYYSLCDKLENQDGTYGPKWSIDDIKSSMPHTEDAPYYNCYALALTMNMLYSDHYNSASRFVPDESIPEYFYSVAIEKLKDVDRKNFIREYFSL